MSYLQLFVSLSDVNFKSSNALFQLLQIKLGLWIDLTNTSRFYDKKMVEEAGCKYVKMQCRGHGETPSPEQTR